MDAGEAEKELTGRRKVRALLIDPLCEEGLRRGRGVTLETHKADLTKIADALKYCSSETLERLRPMVRGAAEGPSANVWPSLATIVNFAHGMEPPPDTSDETLYNWLHSVAGLAARKSGILMATRQYVKDNRRPPVPRTRENREMATKRIFRELQDTQRGIDHRIEELRRRVGMGEATESETARLRKHDDILAGLNSIVDAGIRHREEKAKASEVEAAE